MAADQLPEDQYERRLTALQERYETFSRRVYRVLVLFFVGLLITGGVAAYLYDQNGNQADEITGSLVQGCKENGNPVRTAVRKFGAALVAQSQRNIEQSVAFEKTGVLAEFLPNFTPRERHELVAKSRKEELGTKTELREAKEGVQFVDCDAQYP
jgi:hypothetical protein